MSGIIREAKQIDEPISDVIEKKVNKDVEEIVKGSDGEKEIETNKLSPLLYESTTKVPYSAEYFDVAGTFTALDANTQSNLESINSQFKKEIQSETYDNSKDAFESFIKRYERLTDCKEASFFTKIKTLSEYFKYLQKIK